MAAPQSASPKPQLKGAFTVKVIRCHNLDRKRMVGKMDCYVKVNCGGSEKFETKVAKDGDREPEWNQTLLFNLDGNQTDLHIRVFDQGTLSDDYLGRFDMSLYSLLEGGGGARSFELHDPENFRKIAGTIELSVSFEGTGGPAANAEVAPIVGPFHLLHNSSGFLVHPTGKTSGSGLALRAGGIDQQIVAFEFQGAYIRVCAVPGFYLHAHEGAAGGESTVTIEAGIGDLARWKWTGLGLQHVSSSKIVHPRGDIAVSNTPLVLASGTSAASGFSLVPCKGPPVTPASDEGTPHPATNPHAAASAAAAPVSPASPHTPNSFDLTFPETWPLRAHITSHPHELVRTPQVYQGTYVCDVCKLQGQGIVYHCEAKQCGFDAHPACTKKHIKH